MTNTTQIKTVRYTGKRLDNSELQANEFILEARNGHRVVFTDMNDYVLVWEPKGGQLTYPRRMSREDARNEYSDLMASGFKRTNGKK